MDREIARLSRQLPTWTAERLRTLTPEELRSRGARQQRREPDCPIDEVVVEGRTGPIVARLHAPPDRGPAIGVFLHGGGWVTGRAEDYDVVVDRLAVATKASWLNVEYRLAPEARFPAALDDVLDTVRWAHESMSAESGPGRKVVVAGTSAGANLAAAACLVDRDAGTGRIAGQLLAYPILDATLAAGSYDRDGLSGVNRSLMAWFVSHYLTEHESRRNPLVSPLFAGHFRGLPPAVVVVGDLDVVLDENLEYAARLRAAGVKVRLHVETGAIHGLWNQPVSLAASSIQRAGGALRDLVLGLET